MENSPIPDALSRRHLLEGELDSTKALRIAEAYLEEERRDEAVAFLAKADAREGLEALQEEAVATGDAFLLRSVAAALGTEPGVARWRALAEAATAAGKLECAADAERQVRRDELD